MANLGIILGKSGTGKSTSIKTLNPKETVIINVLGKKLPFKGSSKIYNEENKNLFRIDNHVDLKSMLSMISEKALQVKTIVIDDAIYIMRKEFFSRAKETGYTKFTELAQHFQSIIQLCESLRNDLNIFLILHSEDVSNDKIITSYKVSTVGNLVDSQYNPIEVVPVVFYSSIQYNDKGEATYGFYTRHLLDKTIEIPAKTPDGMFIESFIPNDLGKIIQTMNEYYE